MEKNSKAGGKLPSQKRRSVRFRDTETLSALVDGVPALLFSESRTGCGVLMIPETAPKEGEDVIVQVGELGKVRSRVRWCKKLDDDVMKIGLEYFT